MGLLLPSGVVEGVGVETLESRCRELDVARSLHLKKCQIYEIYVNAAEHLLTCLRGTAATQ